MSASRRITALWLACLLGGGAGAQTLPVFHTAYTTAGGLCDNAISDIETDTNGFLWLATRNGLSRYDGTGFKNYYQSPDGLRSNWITDLERDSLGALWVSTEWGLGRYDARRDRFQYINPAGQLAILYKGPLRARGAALWIAATDGLWRTDIRQPRLQPTRLQKIGDPQCLELDDAGQLFIGTRGNGLYVYNTRNDTYRQLLFPPLTAASHYMSMCRKDGFVWVATDLGLLRIDPQLQGRLFSTLRDNKTAKVEALMTVVPYPVRRFGDMVCGSYDHQLYVFNSREGVFTHRLVSENGLADLSQSPYISSKALAGKLWMGAETGLFFLDPARRAMNLYSLPAVPGEEDVFISNILPAGNGKRLWLQTARHPRLLLYDLPTQRICQSHKLPAGPVRAGAQYFLKDGKDFWLSCGPRLQKRSADGALLRNFVLPFIPMRLLHAPGNRLCTGTDKGLAFIDKETGRSEVIVIPFKGSDLEEKSGPEAFMATGLFLDSGSKVVWVSSIKYGLFRVNYVSGKVRCYRQPVAHYYNARNRCASLVADGAGSLWLGTMDGLTRFDTARRLFYNYRAAAHKVPNYTFQVALDSSGNLWCRSNEGLFCKRAGQDQFLFYDLPLALLNGYLWQQPTPWGAAGVALGYHGGVAVFRPADGRTKGRLPLLITECKTPDSSYFVNAADSRLTLRYPQNSLSIQFAAPVYDRDADIRYEYRMLGRDTAFKPVPLQPQLLYTNLPGGDYLFEVRGSLQGYKPGMARLHLTVIPPFRETIWARLLLFAGAVGSIYGLYRYRLQQVHKEQAFRNRIGRNLHDEMGATLSSINIYSEVGRHSAETGAAKQLFERIFSSSAALQESMSDILWYIHTKEATLQDVLLRLQDFATPLLEARNIAYTFETDHEAPLPLPPACREHLYLIFKEAVNNSLKYAQPRHIAISFLKKGKTFVCRMRDDGRGFDPVAASRGNGLRNMRERAILMKGALEWKTAPGKGCELTLRF